MVMTSKEWLDYEKRKSKSDKKAKKSDKRDETGGKERTKKKSEIL